MATKISTEKSLLAALVAIVTKAAGKENYSAATITLNGNSLSMACFNGAFGGFGTIPVSVTENDDTLRNVPVAARTLADLIATIDEGTVELVMGSAAKKGKGKKDSAVQATVLSIKSGGSVSSLNPLLEATPTPVRMPEVTDAAITVSGKIVRDFAKIAIMASTDEGRPILTGVHFTTHGKGKASVIRAEASDGFRLGRLEKELKTPPAQGLNVVIPAPFVKMVAQSVGENDTVSIFRDGNTVVFSTENGAGRRLVLFSLVIEGTFPDLDQVINGLNSPRSTFEVTTKDLSVAAKQARIMSDEKGSSAVFFKSFPQSAEIGIASGESELGSTKRRLPSLGTVQGQCGVWVSVKFLTEALESLGYNKLKVSLVGEKQPVTFHDHSDEYLSVLMPLGLDGDPFEPKAEEAKAEEQPIPVDFPAAPVQVQVEPDLVDL